MRFQQMSQWLAWQEQLHKSVIDLGLQRMLPVWQRLHGGALPFPVVTVGGTNGKGSTQAMLESMAIAAGLRVGSYSSPHLFKYNERIRLQGLAADDRTIMQAFQAVDDVRAGMTLSYFEFGTLAAMHLFVERGLDLVILEVGLGGRLDAVNAFDADVAIITSIGLDHENWLGRGRESIAREKAGIMRAHKPVIVAEPDPPASLLSFAGQIGAVLVQVNKAYRYTGGTDRWHWQSFDPARDCYYPVPALRGEHQFGNAAAAVTAAEWLQREHKLDINDAARAIGLSRVHLPGRYEKHARAKGGWIIFDVAHNEQAMTQLARQLAKESGEVHAVFSALADKDIEGMVRALIDRVAQWFVAQIDHTRAQQAQTIAAIIRNAGGRVAGVYADTGAAMDAAEAAAPAGDRVLVCGSFYCVADGLRHFHFDGKSDLP